ncbi:hypothetical protein NC651_027763 [Populus alba x Populus x berolinensis]|nr:hypothetical protein NC651_027763 [Populus alba x Populus x berolinensis]
MAPTGKNFCIRSPCVPAINFSACIWKDGADIISSMEGTNTWWLISALKERPCLIKYYMVVELRQAWEDFGCDKQRDIWHELGQNGKGPLPSFLEMKKSRDVIIFIKWEMSTLDGKRDGGFTHRLVGGVEDVIALTQEAQLCWAACHSIHFDMFFSQK